MLIIFPLLIHHSEKNMVVEKRSYKVVLILHYTFFVVGKLSLVL